MGNKEDTGIGNRLQKVADELYEGNVSDLARSLDMKPPSFYKYVNGERRPGTTVLRRLTLLGINLDWLLTGEGKMLQSTAKGLSPLPLTPHMGPSTVELDDNPGDILHRIPLVRVAAADDGTPRLEEKGSAEWLSQSYIEKAYGVEPDLLKSFRVSGDAMRESLRAGDRVRSVLWKGEYLGDGSIYIFYHHPGTVLFRRVRFDGGHVLLTAEHPDLSEISVEAGAWNERLRPIAQVLECIRAL
jgi:phage repressor protein C with HTH and peptisase S24 domain